MPTRPAGLRHTEKQFLRGSHSASPTPGSSAWTALWKAPRLYVKEAHLLILKHWSESTGLLGCSLGMEISGHRLLLSVCFVKATRQYLFFFISLYWFSLLFKEVANFALAFCLAPASRCHLLTPSAVLQSTRISQPKASTHVC